ncbi:AlbA family DNA-binding domain-containing protein [Streptomyces endophyticus]|uniref:ATP-binding protein n=1 Tax=Streptomyces endophyticus TaxID=714166 RepID=A0ABU6FIA8_9ACTN|nr:ATP-binding protein [Streptomyces endophyticus]MEB8342586.1 ATP-binding protein [Streptomyces endophyticus]
MVRRATEGQLPEFDDLDWKEQLPQPPREGRWNELAKDVAAMANTRGGLLVFGVQDKTIELVGVPAGANTEQYRQWIRNHVHPYLPDLDMVELTDGSKTVLIIDVPASEAAPHLVYGTAARDKEQQAAVAPYRANDHTAWMAEHQLERAYRERFARVGLAEHEIQRHLDFTVQSISAQSPTPAAWLVAVSRPQRPLPRGAFEPDRDQARGVLTRAKDRTTRLLAGQRVPAALHGMGDTLYNPRPGLRRWVCSTLELPFNREVLVELHHDGTVVAAISQWLRGRDAEPGDATQPLTVSDRLLQSCCYDIVALVQEHQRELRLDSTQQLTVTLVAPHGPRPLEASTASYWGHGMEGVPEYSRRSHHTQPVHAVLSPAGSDTEASGAADLLHRDLLAQFGI